MMIDYAEQNKIIEKFSRELDLLLEEYQKELPLENVIAVLEAATRDVHAIARNFNKKIEVLK